MASTQKTNTPKKTSGSFVIPTDLGKGTTYYVSSSDGNDNNDGKSICDPGLRLRLSG